MIRLRIAFGTRNSREKAGLGDASLTLRRFKVGLIAFLVGTILIGALVTAIALGFVLVTAILVLGGIATVVLVMKRLLVRRKSSGSDSSHSQVPVKSR